LKSITLVCGTALITALALLGLACGTTSTPPAPSAATSTPGRAPTTSAQISTPPAVGNLTVNIREHSTLGKILVDGSGRTLYRFDRDEKGVSNCSGSCVQTWPPLLLPQGEPRGAPGMGELKTINRSDGGKQVTYKDTPLYHYTPDTQPGDTKGDGVGGSWHVVQP